MPNKITEKTPIPEDLYCIIFKEIDKLNGKGLSEKDQIKRAVCSAMNVWRKKNADKSGG